MKWRTFTDQDEAERFLALCEGVHAGEASTRPDLLADGVSVGSVTTAEYSALYTDSTDWAVPVTPQVEDADGVSYRQYRGSAKCWLAEAIDATTDQEASQGSYTTVVSYTNPWSDSKHSADNPMKVIIVAGQSNARGDTDGTEATALSNAGIASRLEAPETGQLEGTETPVNSASELGRQYAVGDASNMGPEQALADHIINNDSSSDYAVVRVAYGSTNLADDWDPDAVSGLQLYDALVAAIDRARTLWGVIEVELIVWVQGESDAGDAADAAAYEVNLGGFIDSLTSDVAEVTSSTPWYIVYLNDFWDPDAMEAVSRSEYATVRAAQEAVVAARSNVYGVSMDDNEELQSGDEIHYTGAGRVTMGQRVGTAHTGA